MVTTEGDAPAGAARPLLVLTGAAGLVGRRALPALVPHYRLRLVDRDWGGADQRAESGEAECVTLDLRVAEDCAAALDGADAVIHLAGQPSPMIGVREAVEDVAMPTAQLARAAAAAGLRRIVYASSVHAMGLYPVVGGPIRNSWPARPCCEYGAAKVFSENLLQLLTERTAVSAVCLRLGLTGHPPDSPKARRRWFGDDDLGRMLLAALTADVGYGVYFAMSATALGSYDLSDAERDLGYWPQQTAPAVAGVDQPPPADRHCRMT